MKQRNPLKNDIYPNMIAAAIAWRYLTSKKKYSAVGAISTVSVCAVAVATAAIICVLSVFNGFRDLISSRLDNLTPDVIVTPAKGKVMENGDSLLKSIRSIDGVKTATPTLSDNALLLYGSREVPVMIKGIVPDEYESVTSVRHLIGKDYGRYFKADGLTDPLVPEGVAAIGTASRLGVTPGDRMLIFAPKRHGRVNLANPIASFVTDSISTVGVYSAESSQYDDDGLLLPLATARRLLQYESDEASAIEISADSHVSPESLAKKISKALGSGYIIKDRARQQEMSFRMVEIEKWVSFMLLGFILIIAGFNIISSLSMLVLDKERNLSTLQAMGMSRRSIGGVFAWESLYVSMAGGISGIILGIILCLLQQHFGLITIGGDPAASIVRAYPVIVEPTDVIVTLLPVLMISGVTAMITASFARQRI